jgi:branched-chain amino acid transport system substrate-binding protein
MSNTTKWIIGVIILALVVWGVLSQRQSKNQTAEKPNKKELSDVITIGAILPLTGDAATYGEPGKNIYEIAKEEINNSGGINGKKLEIIYEDSKCNGKDASNAIQKLININKVQFVLGGFCSGESLAAEPIATANKVALFSPGSSSPKLTNISKYFFRNYPSDDSQGFALAEASKEKNWKKVAVIQEQTDYSVGLYQSFNTKFSDLGGEIVKEEFPSTTTDFRTSLTKLKNSNPDALFLIVQTPASADRILKQLSNLNWKPALLISDIIPADPKTVSENKTILEGAIAAEFGTDPNNLKFQHILTAYKNKHGVDMPIQSYGQCEYDAVFMAKDALTAVGNDGEKIATWFRNVKDWEGASGKITIQANGDRAGGHRLEVIKNGKVEIYSK